jgi:hypothetical protein
VDDHGMTAAAGDYFTNMETRFHLDHPAISVHSVPSSIEKFINDLFGNTPPPIGDMYIATHASSDGFLFVTLFSGAVDANGNPTDVTDMEVLDQALAPSKPVKIPDSMIGYQSGAPTHSVHIKGCNIGRNRFRANLQPPNPFLVRMKKALGEHVKMTAPKHFHGLIPENSHKGMYEYMAHEFIVRTKAVSRKGKWQGFPDRNALITAYKNAKLTYYDGSLVPDTEWNATLVPKKISMAAGSKITKGVSLPLGRTIEGLTSVPVPTEFRVEIEPVFWPLPAGSFPADEPGRLAKLKASIQADARFASSHPWPMWERRNFTNFNDYWNGHDWSVKTVSKKTGELLCVGRRVDYTVVSPIVDRSVAPPSPRPLIYNFYPGPGSTQQPILTGFVESDNRFFGRA